jgi:hypothetical protein
VALNAAAILPLQAAGMGQTRHHLFFHVTAVKLPAIAIRDRTRNYFLLVYHVEVGPFS